MSHITPSDKVPMPVKSTHPNAADDDGRGALGIEDKLARRSAAGRQYASDRYRDLGGPGQKAYIEHLNIIHREGSSPGPL